MWRAEGRREQFTEFVRAVMVDSRGLWRQFLSLIVGRKRHNILVFSCFFSSFFSNFMSFPLSTVTIHLHAYRYCNHQSTHLSYLFMFLPILLVSHCLFHCLFVLVSQWRIGTCPCFTCMYKASKAKYRPRRFIYKVSQ